MTVRRSCWLLLVPTLLAGCKSADKGGPLGFGVFGSRDATPASDKRASADPLLTNGRIPPQDLPVPGKDGLARNTGRDPLLGRPSDREDRPERAAGTGKRTPPAKPGETSSVPPASVPYRPSSSATPAALAARIDPNDPKYRVGDDPPPVSIGRPDRTADELTRDLKRLGATVTKPALERGEYVARGELELDPDAKPGVRRAYEATGATPAASLKSLLEQMRGDVKR